MFCPYCNDECKRNKCRMWSNKASDCIIAIETENNAEFILDQKESTKVSLVEATANLSDTLNTVMMKQLIRSTQVNDSDRELIKKQYKEFLDKKSIVKLDNMYKKSV